MLGLLGGCPAPAADLVSPYHYARDWRANTWMVPLGPTARRYLSGVANSKQASTEGPLRPVVVRMPVELADAIKAKAASEERTMAQAIRHALRQYTQAAT